MKIGDKHNQLTVIEKVESYINGRSHRSRYRCLCDCGLEFITSATSLRTGKAKQCSACSYKGRPQYKSRRTPLERLYDLSIVSRCKKSNIINELHIDHFSQLIKLDCNYCGEPPRKRILDKSTTVDSRVIFASGVDRLDSSKPYTLDNCVACCKVCNIMKNTLSVDDFISHVNIIAVHTGE